MLRLSYSSVNYQVKLNLEQTQNRLYQKFLFLRKQIPK
jgi:hypothetical protein